LTDVIIRFSLAYPWTRLATLEEEPIVIDLS